MPTDLVQLEPIADLADHPLPEIGLPAMSYAQLWRIARNGTRARTGEVVRLRVSRIGGKLHTSRADIRAYLDELNAADNRHFARADNGTPSTNQPKPRPRLKRRRLASSRDRRAAIRRAEQEAQAAGI